MCKTQYQTDILIIGGGASGLAAAIEIKRINPDLNVIIAERLLKTGKKILASGNGRCNLGNININEDFFHGSVKNKMDIINQTENTETFFNSIGLICTADNCGRMYPYSNTASSVLNCMRNNIIENNVTIESGPKDYRMNVQFLLEANASEKCTLESQVQELQKQE